MKIEINGLPFMGSSTLLTFLQPQNIIESQRYVDLGLPSGKLWAKCNIGATSETENGLYFQWGETEGRTAEEFANKPCDWETAPFNNGLRHYDETCFKHLKDEAYPKGVLEYRFDAVYQATKGKAHMPTKEDFEELIANTHSSWETNFNGSGVNGRKFTSKKDASQYIFIPANGYARYGLFNGRGRYGNIWSSSLNSSIPFSAWGLEFDRSSLRIGYDFRYYGFSVRGIMD